MKKLSSLTMRTYLVFLLINVNSGAMAKAQTDEPKERQEKPVTILTREDIRKMQTSSIRDVLNSIPGITANSSSVNMRGSTKVKVLLNGRPLNNPTSPHGGIKLNQVVVSDIKKIEVIKGGGAVAYGDNASGGVIIITSDSKKGLSGFIKTDMGNYGVRKFRGNVTAVTGDLSLNAIAAWSTKDGFVKNDDGKKYSGGIKADYRFGEKSSLGFAFDYFKNKGGICGKYSRPTPYSRKDYDLIISGINLRLPWLKLHSFVNRGENNNSDISKNKDTTLKVLKTGHKVFTSLPLNNFFNLTMGGGFEYKEGEGKGQYQKKGKMENYGFNKTDEKSCFAFISNSMEIKKLFLTINTGGRFIYYSDYSNILNPEISVAFRTGTFGLKGGFSMTNNTPSFLQRYQATSTKVKNPNVDMERAINYSLSLFASPIKSITITSGAFYNIITDKIALEDNFDGTGKDRMGNIGEVSYKGADSSIKINPSRFFTIKGTYLYLKAEDEKTGRWLSHYPRHHLTGQMELKPLKSLLILLEADYKSKLYIDSNNTEIAKARTLYDASLTYRLGKFTMNFKVENIFNIDHLLSIGLKGYPRRYRASLKFNF